MNAAALMQTMRYLGYTTHLENGEPNPTAEAVANELSGRTLESVMLPAAIATSWAKHAPRFAKAEHRRSAAGTFRYFG